MPEKTILPCVGHGMVSRRMVAPAKEVVFIRGIVEASEGIAVMFAEKGGNLTLVAPMDRERDLDALVDDLCEASGGFRID